MAEYVTSTVVDIVCRLYNCTATKANYVFKLHENLDSLMTSLNTLKGQRDDLNTRVLQEESNPVEDMRRTNTVANWFMRVEALEHEVADISRKGSQLLTGCFCCCPTTPRNCWTGYKLGKLVVQKLPDVEKLKTDGHFEVVVSRVQPAFIGQAMPVNQFEGTDPKVDEILKLVTQQNEIRVIGLYGMGGVGKTYLLKKLNNKFLKKDFHKSHNYDLVVWAVVSKDLNLLHVQKQIGDPLGLLWNNPEETDVTRRAQDICRVLSKKKFVLLLDDIWQRVDLQTIGIPPLDESDEETKSKVVFTTRSEFVCGLMDAEKKIRIECLEWDEAWNLFQTKVGQEALTCHPQVPELAKIIVKECGFLPLAINAVGRAMASKKTLHEWKYAVTELRESASRFSGMNIEVLPTLKFSYDNLLKVGSSDSSDRIKSCFLYCSLYPEGHSISKKELIDCWMAEGFLDEYDDIDETINQGHEVIGSLKAACLLESGVNMEKEVKMHDVVLDMAIWVATDCERNKHKFLIRSSNKPKLNEWEEAERISLVRNKISDLVIEAPNCSNLFTLMLQHTQLETISDNFFQFMQVLKVLNLSRTNIKEIPESTKLLLELHYLNLSSTRNLSKIPPGVIPCFSKLQVLDLYDSKFGGWELEGGPVINELKDLAYLNDLGITVNNFLALQKLVSSQKLQSCTKRLCIHEANITKIALSPTSSSSSSSSSFSVSLASLKSVNTLKFIDCHKLERLIIGFVNKKEGEITLFDTLESLEILFCPKTDIIWDGVLPHQSFSTTLQFVRIHACGSVKNLTWICYARGLKTLSLWYLSELQEVISDRFNEDVDNTFLKLETLELLALPHLKSICKKKLAFPCLETIDVSDCRKLMKLPLKADSAKNTLRWIKGESGWWENLEWEDISIKPTFESCFMAS